MAQAGLHALVGVVTQKMSVRKTWLFLGVLLGSMFPDMDNYLVAIGTVTGVENPGEVFHRTFTHSVFTILFMILVFFVVGAVRKDDRWRNLGVGFGVGIALHMLLDLVIWYNGVPLFWPLGTELNFWEGVEKPALLEKLLNPAELLFFGLFFFWLLRSAQNTNTNVPLRPVVRMWMNVMFFLFFLFAFLAFMNLGGFTKTLDMIYGVVYLVGLTAAFFYTIKMRASFEEA